MIKCKHCNKQLSPKTKIHRCFKAGVLRVDEDTSFIEGTFPVKKKRIKFNLFRWLFSGDGYYMDDHDWFDGDGDGDLFD